MKKCGLAKGTSYRSPAGAPPLLILVKWQCHLGAMVGQRWAQARCGGTEALHLGGREGGS